MVRKLIRIVDPEKSLTWLEDFIDVVFTEKANGTINITNGLIVLNSTELIPADYPVWKLQDYRLLCSADGGKITGFMSMENWSIGALEFQAY